jgi:hypothetical protein
MMRHIAAPPPTDQQAAIADERNMTIQQQHQSFLRSRRDDYVGTAIFALQLAFKATPVNQHEKLLDDVYQQVIQRVFGDEARQ